MIDARLKVSIARVVFAIDALCIHRSGNRASDPKKSPRVSIRKISTEPSEPKSAGRARNLPMSTRFGPGSLKVKRAANRIRTVKRAAGSAKDLNTTRAGQSKVAQKRRSIAGYRSRVAKSDAVNKNGGVLISKAARFY